MLDDYTAGLGRSGRCLEVLSATFFRTVDVTSFACIEASASLGGTRGISGAGAAPFVVFLCRLFGRCCVRIKPPFDFWPF